MRYVGGVHVDPGTGTINGSAFDRQPKDADGLSLNRRGIFALDTTADRAAIRAAMAARMALGATAVFAELDVADIVQSLARFGRPIMLVADPLPPNGTTAANPAHALLLGLPFAGETAGSLTSEIAGDLLKRCIRDRFPARSAKS